MIASMIIRLAAAYRRLEIARKDRDILAMEVALRQIQRLEDDYYNNNVSAPALGLVKAK